MTQPQTVFPSASDVPPAPLAARPAARARRLTGRIRADRYGTLVFFAIFFLVIGVTQGQAFLSWDNVSLVLGDNSYLAFLAAAAVTTLIVGQFDLSVGATAGTSAVMVAYLTSEGRSVAFSMAVVVVFGAAVGLVNSLLVVRLQINAFIATLGTGGALAGVSQWISDGQTLFEGIPTGLTDAGGGKLFGEIPYPLLYAAGLTLVMWAVTRKFIIGRYWYATGANAEAARLAGVGVARATTLAFMTTGVLAAMAGIIATSRFGSADPSTGANLLLPAFAAAFLGSSILSDGGFSIVGAILGTFLIQLAVNGLDVAGVNFAVKPIFNGLVLVGAVAITEYLRRRRRSAPAPVLDPDAVPAGVTPTAARQPGLADDERQAP